MSDPTPKTPDPLAIALSKLDPAPHGFNRDALMFAAGRESKAWTIKFWQVVAGVATVVVAVFGYLYFTRIQ
jgi:zinc transporter ZupT